MIGVTHAPDAAFVDEFGRGEGEALDVMAVDEVAGVADGIGFASVGGDVVLGDDGFADHAAGFADVELVGEVVVVSELVFVEAEGFHFVLNMGGDGGVAGEKMEETKGVVEVIVVDGFALVVAGVGPGELAAEVAEGNDSGLFVVEFELAVAAFVEVEDVVELGGFVFGGLITKPVGEDGVAVGIVIFWGGDGNLEIGIFGDGEAEVVVHGRGMGVAFGVVLGPAADAGEEIATVVGGAGGAWSFVETDAGGFLVELGFRFATDGVADASAGHEVSFVAGIDELFGVDDGAVGEGDVSDAGAGFVDLGDAGSVADVDFGFGEHGVVGFLGDAGFEVVFGLVGAVVRAEPAVEFVGKTADGPFEHVLGFGGVDAAGAESADVFLGFDEDDAGSLAGGSDGGSDATGDAAVDDDVGVEGLGLSLGVDEASQGEQENVPEFFHGRKIRWYGVQSGCGRLGQRKMIFCWRSVGMGGWLGAYERQYSGEDALLSVWSDGFCGVAGD